MAKQSTTVETSPLISQSDSRNLFVIAWDFLRTLALSAERGANTLNTVLVSVDKITVKGTNALEKELANL